MFRSYGSFKCHIILFSDCREVETVSVSQMSGWQSWFSNRPKNKLGRRLRSTFLSSSFEFCLAVAEKKLNMYQPIRDRGCLVFFLYGLNFIYLEEDVVEENSKRSHQIRGKCGNFGFLIILKNTNFVKDPFSEVSLNSPQLYRKKDDGQDVISIGHLSIQLRCTKNYNHG